MIFISIFQAFYHLRFEFLESFSFHFLYQNYDKETLIPEQIKNRTILIRTISRDPYHPLNSTLKIIFIFPRSKKKRKKKQYYNSSSFHKFIHRFHWSNRKFNIQTFKIYVNKFDYRIVIRRCKIFCLIRFILINSISSSVTRTLWPIIRF